MRPYEFYLTFLAQVAFIPHRNSDIVPIVFSESWWNELLGYIPFRKQVYSTCVNRWRRGNSNNWFANDIKLNDIKFNDLASYSEGQLLNRMQT